MIIILTYLIPFIQNCVDIITQNVRHDNMPAHAKNFEITTNKTGDSSLTSISDWRLHALRHANFGHAKFGLAITCVADVLSNRTGDYMRYRRSLAITIKTSKIGPVWKKPMESDRISLKNTFTTSKIGLVRTKPIESDRISLKNILTTRKIGSVWTKPIEIDRISLKNAN